jgi:hypothetical protein
MKISSVAVRGGIVLLGTSLAPIAAIAHHSRAHYGTEVVELDAEIVEIDWRNPHVTFTMKATSESGEEQIWALEGGSTYMLGRYSGLGRDLFNVGDNVRIAGPISGIRPNEMLITNMLLPDGREAIMVPRSPIRWADRVSGEDLNVQMDNPERSLFRVWSIDPNAPGGASQQVLPLTAAAAASVSSYNREEDDPALRCVKPGMPSTMSNPHPMHFSDGGDRVIVNVQENDVVRTIYLGENAAAAQVTSPLGYSVGHWEDRILVVRTTNINWPYFDRTGIPLSTEAVVEERFEISEAGSHLVINIVTTDPTNFTAPVLTQRRYALLGEAVKTYDCVAR